MQLLQTEGYEILNPIYSSKEIDKISGLIDTIADQNSFSVRAFLMDKPTLQNLIFTPKLLGLVQSILKNSFLIKSIYFNKPPRKNWIVQWHQDLTINVTEKQEIPNFKNWRVLKERTVVQPALNYLENIFTIRIHLDECTEKNGALRVIPNQIV